MIISEQMKDVLADAQVLLADSKLTEKLSKTITSSSDKTWLDVATNVLPVVISTVEKGKVELTSNEKSKLVSDLILPLIKDKLPWYIKPFASKLVNYVIDIIVGALNKLFTKDWSKKEEAVAEIKAEEK